MSASAGSKETTTAGTTELDKVVRKKSAKGPALLENFEPWKSIGPDKFQESKWSVVGAAAVFC